MKTTSEPLIRIPVFILLLQEEEYKNIMNEMINRSGWKDLKLLNIKMYISQQVFAVVV